MSKIEFGSFVSKAGKEYRTLDIADLLRAVGLAGQVEVGYGISADKKSLILWEPRVEIKEAKAKGIMGKPLSKMANQPVNEGAEEKVSNSDLSSLKAELAILTKAVSMLMKPEHISDLIGQTNPVAREAPVGTTITRKRKAA